MGQGWAPTSVRVDARRGMRPGPPPRASSQTQAPTVGSAAGADITAGMPDRQQLRHRPVALGPNRLKRSGAGFHDPHPNRERTPGQQRRVAIRRNTDEWSGA